MTEKPQIQQQKHITRELFERWQEGVLPRQEELDFWEHTGSCTYCAKQFADWIEEGLPKEPPAYLREEIEGRIRQTDIQMSVKVRQTSKRAQLMMYSLKVGLAVAASIFLLTLTSDVQRMGMELPEAPKTEEVQQKESFTQKLSRGSSRLAEYLNQFTNDLFRVE